MAELCVGLSASRYDLLIGSRRSPEEEVAEKEELCPAVGQRRRQFNFRNLGYWDGGG